MSLDRKPGQSLSRLAMRTMGVLAGTLIFIFLVLLLAATVALSLPLRAVAYYLAKVFRPNIVDFVRSSSATITLLQEPNDKNIITALLVVDGPLKLSKFTQDVKKRVLEARDEDGELILGKLQQVYVNFSGFLFREWDSNFDISRHVFDFEPSARPVDGAQFYSRKDLSHILPELVNSVPRWMERSRWELRLLHNYRETLDLTHNQTVVVFRFHHSLCDGYSLINILKHLCGRRDKQPQKKSLQSRVAGTLYILSEYSRMWKDAGEEFFNMVLDSICNRRWTTGAEARSEHILVSTTRPFRVDRVKAIRKYFHVPYVAVIHAMLGGAFHEFIKRSTKSGAGIPNSVLCMTSLPMPNHPGAVSNHVYVSHVPILIKEMSPLERLSESNLLIRKRNKSRGKYGLQLLVNLLGLLPIALRDAFNKYSLVRPKVAFGDMLPLDSIQYNGKDAVDMICVVGNVPYEPSILLGHQGIANLVRLCVSFPQGIFSTSSEDAQIFCRHLEMELEKLEKLCIISTMGEEAQSSKFY